MTDKKSVPWHVVALAGGLLAQTGPVRAESYVLPSSVFRAGANAAEYRTDVRLLNQGTTAVAVTATLYDQVTSAALPATPFSLEARSQVAFDNILQSLFGKTLSQGAYGPIRFDATGPIIVASSVNNVNACGSGAVSGQWLPGIMASQALKAGTIGQLAVSASTGSGYRTNLVFMNPGSAAATATVRVRRGGGALLSTGTLGPLPANGFSQVALDGPVFPGVADTTDTNVWLEFTSDQPVLAYATMIHNVSGDPFAVMASVDTPGSARAGTYILPSSVFRTGTNAAEYRTDVRLLNQGTTAVTVTATLYDQVTAAALPAVPFQVGARSQVAFDNILQSLFGRTLSQGAYGPIRFETTGPILVASSVNNVNACGSGAVSGQWLPGIAASQALKAGVIGQVAASSSTASGYRTNLVFTNPGSAAATATVKVRRGGGELLSTGTIGPLPTNGFTQVALDSAVFSGVAGTTDTNLWLEFTSDQPVLAYATMIHNVSGDPFGVAASSDGSGSPYAGNWTGKYGSGRYGFSFVVNVKGEVVDFWLTNYASCGFGCPTVFAEMRSTTPITIAEDGSFALGLRSEVAGNIIVTDVTAKFNSRSELTATAVDTIALTLPCLCFGGTSSYSLTASSDCVDRPREGDSTTRFCH